MNLDGVIDAEEFAEALLNRRCSGQLHLGTDILDVMVYIDIWNILGIKILGKEKWEEHILGKRYWETKNCVKQM